jgi:hypothetical protein
MARADVERWLPDTTLADQRLKSRTFWLAVVAALGAVATVLIEVAK